MVMGGLYTHIPNTVLRTFSANKSSLFFSGLYVPGSLAGDMGTRSGIKDTLTRGFRMHSYGISLCHGSFPADVIKYPDKINSGSVVV